MTGAPIQSETDAAKIARLERELAAALRTIEGYQKREQDAARREALIVEKISLGFSRTQAIELIERERIRRGELEQVWGMRRPELIKILESTPEPTQARAKAATLWRDISTEEIAAALTEMAAKNFL